MFAFLNHSINLLSFLFQTKQQWCKYSRHCLLYLDIIWLLFQIYFSFSVGVTQSQWLLGPLLLLPARFFFFWQTPGHSFVRWRTKMCVGTNKQDQVWEVIRGVRHTRGFILVKWCNVMQSDGCHGPTCIRQYSRYKTMQPMQLLRVWFKGKQHQLLYQTRPIIKI